MSPDLLREVTLECYCLRLCKGQVFSNFWLYYLYYVWVLTCFECLVLDSSGLLDVLANPQGEGGSLHLHTVQVHVHAVLPPAGRIGIKGTVWREMDVFTSIPLKYTYTWCFPLQSGLELKGQSDERRMPSPPYGQVDIKAVLSPAVSIRIKGRVWRENGDPVTSIPFRYTHTRCFPLQSGLELKGKSYERRTSSPPYRSGTRIRGASPCSQD